MNNMTFISNDNISTSFINDKEVGKGNVQTNTLYEFMKVVDKAYFTRGSTESQRYISQAESLYETCLTYTVNQKILEQYYEKLQICKDAVKDHEYDYVFTYNADGSIKSLAILITYYNFTTSEDYYRVIIKAYDHTAKMQVLDITKNAFAASVKVNGEVIKPKIDGVAYLSATIKMSNYNTINHFLTITAEDYKVGGAIITSSHDFLIQADKEVFV